MSDPIPSLSEIAWAGFFSRVEALTGLHFTPSRASSAKLAIMRQFPALDSQALHQLTDELSENKAIMGAVTSALTVGETYFFRDPQHFELIRTTILPELLQHTPPQETLRLWSAGCSSGEEAYSLAFMASNLGLGEKTKIIASDISNAALEKARAARYRDWSFRSADSRLLRSVSKPDPEFEDTLTLPRWLRKRVCFRNINLSAPDFSPFRSGLFPIHIILCRNVLIYLSPQAIKVASKNLFEALAPGGYLITGPSDPLLPLTPDVSQTLLNGVRVYQKARQTQTRGISSSRPGLPAPPKALPRPTPASAASLSPSPASSQERELTVLRELARKDIDLALSRLRSILEQSPNSAKFHYLLGVLLTHQGDYQSALDSIRRALYLDPNLLTAYHVLATLLFRQGNLRGAVRNLKNIIEQADDTAAEKHFWSFEHSSLKELVQSARDHLSLIQDAEEAA